MIYHLVLVFLLAGHEPVAFLSKEEFKDLRSCNEVMLKIDLKQNWIATCRADHAA